jgi:asparagine synthase (glutamine-hydrolysing)
MAREFFGRNLSRSAAPGFSHEVRWQSTSSLKRLFSPQIREAIDGRDSAAELFALLPPDFARWAPLAQDQYLEIRTLLTGYILSSQGDRMLMAHSIEGRFPFLDSEVVALAASLPPKYKLRVLDEKYILKRAGAGRVPAEIIRRKKQPYRAPDAMSFVGSDAAWIEDALRSEHVAQACVFNPTAVAQLWAKCQARRDEGQFSNSDNMALVGVLSTQLLDAQFIRRAPVVSSPVTLKTTIDRLERDPIERDSSTARLSP